MYKMRVLPWSNTFVSVGGGLDQFQLLLVTASRFTSAIERSGKWKKVDNSGGTFHRRYTQAVEKHGFSTI
jgi:hypothetical protein